MRTLLTGMGGTGKTTLIRELQKRGYVALDLDDIDVCAWINKETGEEVRYIEGAGADWISRHRWQVLMPKLEKVLAKHDSSTDVFMGGKISKHQAKDLAKIFDRLYLLQPTDELLNHRLATRTSHPKNFGRKEEERAMVLQNRQSFEQSCIEAGATVINNSGTVEEALVRITGEALE